MAGAAQRSREGEPPRDEAPSRHRPPVSGPDPRRPGPRAAERVAIRASPARGDPGSGHRLLRRPGRALRRRICLRGEPRTGLADWGGGRDERFEFGIDVIIRGLETYARAIETQDDGSA